MIGPKLINRNTQIRNFNTLDSATKAFINALALDGVVLTPTQTRALNRLVLNYKAKGNLNTSFNFWNNSVAIYPIIGGSATAHKYNLKDPKNTNAAFRLSFSGGWTHNNNGITGNGVNTFANTFLIPNTQFASSNSRFGIYVRSNILENKLDMGTVSGGGNENMIASRFINLFYVNYGNTTTYGTAANTDSRGLFVMNRNNASNTLGYKNGSLLITHAETEIRSSIAMYIGAINNTGSAAAFSTRNYAFSVLGQGLSDANCLLEYQIIQQFQNDLGRGV